MSNVGILSVQFNPVIGDKKANLQKAFDIIKQYCDKKLDLVILPDSLVQVLMTTRLLTSLNQKTAESYRVYERNR